MPCVPPSRRKRSTISDAEVPVWRAVALVHEYGGDITKTADHLAWPESKVKVALNYAEAYPQEMDDAIAKDRTFDFETLKRLIPSLELLQVPSKESKTT